MKVRAVLALALSLAATGMLLPPGVHAEPPPGGTPIVGSATGLNVLVGTGSWYDYGIQSGNTDPYGKWSFAPAVVNYPAYWIALDVTSVDPAVDVNGDLRRWKIRGTSEPINGVTATLWKDRNQDGVFGGNPDLPALDTDVTHCTGAPPFYCGDYVLNGGAAGDVRGVTLELSQAQFGSIGVFGWMWTK